MSIFPITIDYEKSHGSYVHDKNSNREFLDMHSQFSSLALGYNHPVFKSPEFIDEITPVSQMKTSFCAYECEEKKEFEKEFRIFAVPEGFDFIHYTCTGALAVESAIKASWHHHNYKRKLVISFENSFHGVNSFGNFLSTSSRLDGIPDSLWSEKFDINGEWEKFAETYHKDIAAIIVEPIQCTFGDKYISRDNLIRIREVCTRLGIVLIFDEIQTGLSTGDVWYWQRLGFQPDIIVFGKKFQTSGIIVRKGFDKIREDFMRLSVTFDGDICDMIRSKYILKTIRINNLMHDSYYQLMRFLWDLDGRILNLKITGCLIAFDFESKSHRDFFTNKTFENGLLVNSTGEKTVRLRPNLSVTFDEVSEAIEIINSSLL